MDCGCAGVSLPFLDFFHPKENHRGALGRYCDGVRLFLHHCTFLERRHFTSRNTVNPKPDLRHSSSAILSVFHEITQNRDWEEISKTFVKLIVLWRSIFPFLFLWEYKNNYSSYSSGTARHSSFSYAVKYWYTSVTGSPHFAQYSVSCNACILDVSFHPFQFHLTRYNALRPECVYFFFFFLFFFGLFAIFWATFSAYGGSQARGRIGAVAAGLHHSHSNAGSQPCLRPTPQLTATLSEARDRTRNLHGS